MSRCMTEFLPCRPGIKSRARESMCVPLVLEKEFLRELRRNKDIDGPGCHSLLFPSQLLLPHLAVTCPLSPANGCGYRGSPAQGSGFACAFCVLRNKVIREAGQVARAAHKYFCAPAPLPSAWFECWWSWLACLLGIGLLQIFQSALKRRANAGASGLPPPPSYFSPHHFRPSLT